MIHYYDSSWLVALFRERMHHFLGLWPYPIP